MMPSFTIVRYCSALVAFASFTSITSAHSWVEQLTVIDPDGTFTGAPGFPRGNVLRTAPNFGDPLMVNLLPPNGRAAADGILKSDPMCKDSQKKPVQTDGSPRLQAAPGSLVALRYQENGHVTLPENQPGKPKNRGNVFIYGTTQPSETDTFLGIHKQWNAEGTGGDKRGKLLATQPFDDSQCYQINGGAISANRQAKFPHQPSPLTGGDLWCQNDIAIPADAPTGKPYTLYWVWDWPTSPNVDPGLPKGKEESYTTCMDVQVVDKPDTKASAPAQKNLDIKASADSSLLNNMAIPQYMKDLTQKSDAPALPPAQPQSSPSPPQHSTAPQAGQQPESQAPLSHETPAPQNPTVKPTLAVPAPVTITVTKVPEEKSVTITVTAADAEPTPATTIVTISPSPSTTYLTTTVEPSASPIRSTEQVPTQPTTLAGFIKSFAGTASALPATTSVINPTSPSNVVRCDSCKLHKRSRIFGAAGHRHHRH